MFCRSRDCSDQTCLTQRGQRYHPSPPHSLAPVSTLKQPARPLQRLWGHPLAQTARAEPATAKRRRAAATRRQRRLLGGPVQPRPRRHPRLCRPLAPDPRTAPRPLLGVPCQQP